MIVKTVPHGSPVVSVVNPLGTTGDPIKVSLGSRISGCSCSSENWKN